jgi:lipopolysaccharide heptosyltransferase II
MFDHLDINTPAERWAVGLADAALTVLAWPIRRRPKRARPQRILLLRLERIGDLLMSLGAIRAVRAQAPEATIDLVVGSWNAPLARLIAEVNTVEIVDAAWLARGAGGESAASLARRAAGWRGRRYDLAINFEGDIRSHGLLALSGARRRVGFAHAGGGPLLTDVVAFDGGRHVADNGLALVECAFDLPAGSLARADIRAGASLWRLQLPEAAHAAARAAVAQLGGARLAPDGPLLAVHAPGGRAIKQWPVERFADAASVLATDIGAAVVLTGASGDEAIVSEMESRLKARGVRTLRVQGTTDLVVLAAMLHQCRALLTGDTGPMHLAAAVGTPVLAVFGPSMPWRYGPLVEPSRVVRVDLPCSPCNRIRLPPERCQGHTPDCLAEVHVEAVVAAGRSLLASRGAGAPTVAR